MGPPFVVRVIYLDPTISLSLPNNLRLAYRAQELERKNRSDVLEAMFSDGSFRCVSPLVFAGTDRQMWVTLYLHLCHGAGREKKKTHPVWKKTKREAGRHCARNV